ncbi:MAG TPA: RNA polymerase sigma factor [Streptosporangiaceae bacterium]|nr:RNA polymerase sigma factor [Streptosporangiaceae bacterium]
MDTGPDGFSSFYQENYSRIAALVAALLGDRHQGEGITQEAFARALARWKHIDAPGTWVRRVAQQLAIDTGRPKEPDPRTATPLSSALMRLPIQQRRVLVLSYLAGLPADEIAGDCGLTPGAVRTRLAAARHRLDQELGQTPVPSAGAVEGMGDDELRAELAAWVHEVATQPAPGLDVLRRQGRGRKLRRAAAVGAAAVVIAGIGVGLAVQGSGSGHARGAVASDHQRHSAGPAAASSTTARWTSYPHAWFPGQKLPAADAGPSVAPYLVEVVNNSTTYVASMVTGGQIAPVNGPANTSFVGVTAAGEDHTFVLAAAQGNAVQFYEVRLGAGGRPGTPVLVLSIPLTSIMPSYSSGTSLDFAISPDASMLAYMKLGGLEVVSLATGQATSWPGSGGLEGNLSWAANDRSLAFQWGTTSDPAQSGMRVLDTKATGSLLQASRLVIPARTMADYTGDALMTPDASKIFMPIYSDISGQNGPADGEMGEFSTRTGREVAVVTPKVHVNVSSSSGAQLDCQPLWTDASGSQVASFCASSLSSDSSGVFMDDDGHITSTSLETPVTLAQFYGDGSPSIFGPSFAW